MLLDCGAGTLPALPRYGLDWPAVTHVFLSHFHLDHIAELPALLFALKHSPEVEQRASPLRVMGPAGTVDLLRAWEVALGYDLLTLRFPVEVEEMHPGREVRLADGHSMRVHPTLHTKESLAVRLQERGASVCYTGDATYSDELAAFSRKADLLIAECSFEKPRAELRHMSIPEVAKLARRAEVPRLMATHLYPELDRVDVRGEIARIFSGSVIIAHDGLRLEI